MSRLMASLGHHSYNPSVPVLYSVMHSIFKLAISTRDDKVFADWLLGGPHSCRAGCSQRFVAWHTSMAPKRSEIWINKLLRSFPQVHVLVVSYTVTWLRSFVQCCMCNAHIGKYICLKEMMMIWKHFIHMHCYCCQKYFWTTLVRAHLSTGWRVWAADRKSSSRAVTRPAGPGPSITSSTNPVTSAQRLE